MKLSALTLLATLSLASSAPTVLQPRTPPNIPSAAAAVGMLASLSTRTVDATGYNRDLFPHWITQSGTCKYSPPPPPRPICADANAPSTREVVLQRDGTNVVQSSSCAATSGSWFSPYDGATWTDAADVVCMPPAATAAVCLTSRRISTIWSRFRTRGSPAPGSGYSP